MRRSAHLISAILTVAISIAAVTASQAGERITNAFAHGQSVDIVNGGQFDGMVWLADSGRYSGQDWTLTPEADGYGRLRTSFTGKNRCLDVINGGQLDGYLIMADCGNYSGQLWEVVEQYNGELTLRSMFTGNELCAMPDLNGPMASFIHMSQCDAVTSQYWRFRPFR